MTVIGINPAAWESFDRGQRFATERNLGYTNLWDGSNAVHEHYGMPGTSGFWLLDKNGDRAHDRASSFSSLGNLLGRERLDEPNGVEKLLDNLE